MQGTPYQFGAGYPQYTQQPGHYYYPSAPMPGAPAWQQQAPVQPPANNQFGHGDRWGNPFDDKEENVLFHAVADGDTLMGLSLTYGVSVQAIKKANGITSDEIYYIPSIKIPNPKRYKPSDGADDPTKLQADKSVTLKQAFKNRTGESDPEIIQNYLSRAANNYQDAVELYEKEKNALTWRKQHVQDLKMRMDKDDRDDKVATFYLEISDWNFDQALKAYKEDLRVTNNKWNCGLAGLARRPSSWQHQLTSSPSTRPSRRLDRFRSTTSSLCTSTILQTRTFTCSPAVWSVAVCLVSKLEPNHFLRERFEVFVVCPSVWSCFRPLCLLCQKRQVTRPGNGSNLNFDQPGFIT